MPRPDGITPPFSGTFRTCAECGHANFLSGCECETRRCICYKKRTKDWNGLKQVNGGVLDGLGSLPLTGYVLGACSPRA